MPFTKIRYADKEVTLELSEQPSSARHVDQVVASHEKPHPDFITAMQAMKAPSLAFIELPDNYAAGIEVRSVALSRDKKDYEACVVTMVKKLEKTNRPLVIHTPLISEKPDAQGKREMPEAMHDALAELVREAEAYLNQGKREQADLFDPSSNGASVTTDPFDDAALTQSVNGTRVKKGRRAPARA